MKITRKQLRRIINEAMRSPDAEMAADAAERGASKPQAYAAHYGDKIEFGSLAGDPLLRFSIDPRRHNQSTQDAFHQLVQTKGQIGDKDGLGEYLYSLLDKESKDMISLGDLKQARFREGWNYHTS